MTRTRQHQLRAALARRPAQPPATVRVVYHAPKPKAHPRGHEPDTASLDQRINSAKATAAWWQDQADAVTNPLIKARYEAHSADWDRRVQGLIAQRPPTTAILL